MLHPTLRPALALLGSLALAGCAALQVASTPAPAGSGAPSPAASGAPAAAPTASPGGLQIGASASPAAPVHELVGQAVPNLSFIDTESKAFKLAEVDPGKAKLVVLWAHWCPHCQREMPIIDAISRELREVSIVSIEASKGTLDDVKGFKDKYKIANLKLYADPAGQAGVDMKLKGFPALYFVDKGGKVVDFFSGEMEGEELKKRLNALK